MNKQDKKQILGEIQAYHKALLSLFDNLMCDSEGNIKDKLYIASDAYTIYCKLDNIECHLKQELGISV